MNELMDFIQQVKQSNDIVDVIGSYLELRQSGTNHFARCPFHGEKTASFNVNRNMQIYHCFGCGESGDVIKFVQMYESCTFMEALEILAKRAGLKMPETQAQKKDKAFDEKKKKRDTYLEICKNTAVFYYRNFFKYESGKIAREYMYGRGFTEETLKKFGIGYSPDMYSLVKHLESLHFSHEDCLKCGVLQQTRNGTPFDALAGRVIVPIYNMNGKVIAFGGRGIDEKTIAYGKYKNTQDTPLFTKRDNLFALNLAKEEKQQKIQGGLPNLVIVEGYMDVIAMYQAGFRRAVASMGTSLTENQAKLLSRLTDSVYICYDGDSAGQKATVRGMDILDEAGLEVKVMSIPNNLDPDEHIKAYGAQSFENLVNAALPLPDYKIQLLERAFPIDKVDAATRNNNIPKFVNGAVKMLKQLDDVRQAQYIAAISLKTGYSQEFFRRKLEGERTDEPIVTDTLSTENKAKYFVAACLFAGQSYASLAEKPYCESTFLSQVYDYLLQCRKNDEQPRVDMLYTICPDASQEEYSRIVDVDFSPSRQEKNAQYFAECKKIIVTEKLKQQRDELLQQLKSQPENTQLLVQIAELSRKING